MPDSADKPNRLAPHAEVMTWPAMEQADYLDESRLDRYPDRDDVSAVGSVAYIKALLEQRSA